MTLTKISGSVVENLKRIKGADRKINTIEEAKALLEYMPRADIRCTEDNIRLYQAYQDAQKILNGTDMNLGETFVRYYNKALEKGGELLANVSNRIKTWGDYLASM